jgi:hypothetical protein
VLAAIVSARAGDYMEPRYYDTAIIGTTFLGLGAALHMQNVVVIEKGGLLGAEFINSYKVCEMKQVHPQTECGQKFMQELSLRGLVSESAESLIQLFVLCSMRCLRIYVQQKA